ncbi:MAG: NAD(P)H-dependent oxidoreductase subunit E [Treponema sp.]|jgi:NADH-quinone oxidoreductase subunit E|nr:NAD(P)H-dependent oxidoreductase subunit E [Treponema sp.]
MTSTVFDYEAVDGIVDELGAKPSSVIAILQGIQEQYRYLPAEIFPHLAKRLKVSEARIYGVATFYENFSLEPKGKYIIKVCDGTACHVRKSIPNLERLRGELGLSASRITTGDLGFTVQTVACLGACSLAPALTVNNKVYAAMTPEKVSKLLEELRADIAAGGEGN